MYSALRGGGGAIEKKKKRRLLLVMVASLCFLLPLVRQQRLVADAMVRGRMTTPTDINSVVLLVATPKNPTSVDVGVKGAEYTSASSPDDHDDDDRPYLVLHMGPKKVLNNFWDCVIYSSFPLLTFSSCFVFTSLQQITTGRNDVSPIILVESQIDERLDARQLRISRKVPWWHLSSSHAQRLQRDLRPFIDRGIIIAVIVENIKYEYYESESN